MSLVLITEDNHEVAEIYQRVLGDAYDYMVIDSIAAVKSVLVRSPRQSPSLFIADLILKDGVLSEKVFSDPSMAPALRWPTIVVSVKDDIESLEKCLKYWAQDYITKPFLHNEFLVKARRILESGLLRQTPLRFCGISMRAYHGDLASEPLTAQEAKVFCFLIAQPNSRATKEQLMSAVWRESKESKKLSVTVTRLRKKLFPLNLAIQYLADDNDYQLTAFPTD